MSYNIVITNIISKKSDRHLIRFLLASFPIMTYSYHIGLRHIVKEDAPFWNCNSIEDVGNEIQRELDLTEFKAREIFKANEETILGTNDKVFTCIWMESDIGGVEPDNSVPDGLLELAPQILEEFGTAPNKCGLPGVHSDILVPNLPKLDESPFTDSLNWHRNFNCRNLEMFGREKMSLGSLNAGIEAIELALSEGTVEPEFVVITKQILSKMKLAQKYDLFFTFRH